MKLWDIKWAMLHCRQESQGYFVCGGKCVEITWERETNTDPFRYYLKDGTPLELGVGSTYVGIRPSYGSSVSFDKEAQ